VDISSTNFAWGHSYDYGNLTICLRLDKLWWPPISGGCVKIVAGLCVSVVRVRCFTLVGIAFQESSLWCFSTFKSLHHIYWYFIWPSPESTCEGTTQRSGGYRGYDLLGVIVSLFNLEAECCNKKPKHVAQTLGLDIRRDLEKWERIC